MRTTLFITAAVMVMVLSVVAAAIASSVLEANAQRPITPPELGCINAEIQSREKARCGDHMP